MQSNPSIPTKYYRFARRKRAKDLSGEGARLHGGRFNHRDIPALCLSVAPSTSVLEVLAHAGEAPAGHVMTRFSLTPEQVDLIKVFGLDDMPAGWDHETNYSVGQTFGKQHLFEPNGFGILVPSRTTRIEHNLVINVRHPLAGSLTVEDVPEFIYDARTFKKG